MEKLKVNSIQNFVEKGLQSQNLSDVLITITECGRCIQDNPFPNFMHSTLLRLAQAFHGEVFGRKFEHSMNTIRLRIVTAIRECSPSLRLNFSLSEEIVRIIMKVSHSNDYKARALTLLLLASLAPMLSEDKKVHNLVIESLDCNESIELSAAIHAANELAKFSMTFPSLIIRKIAEMFGQNQLSNSMKIQLFEIISNLRDLTVAENCIDLGKALLDKPADEKMHMTVYNSLTYLACRCSTILSDQISILLSELSKNIGQKNKILVHCVLRNLSKIASQQQYWTQENVETFCNFYANILSLASKGILCNWLHCLEVISSVESYYFPILNEKHPWSTLLASPCIVVRIFAIKLSHNLLQNGGINKQFRDEILESISKTLFHFIREPQSNSRIMRESRFEFLKLLSNFVRSTKCLPEFAISICKLILEAKLTEQNKDLFELLAVVSETYWDKCQQIVSSILIDEIGKNQNLKEIPSIVFTLLFLTTPINPFASAAEQNLELLSDFANRLLSHPHFDHWSLYKIARSALRSGHLRLIALPLLQRIQKSCENMETASYIDGLIHICQTQPTSFSVKELSKYESGLQNAALNFKALASTGKSQPFTFAADYANCLQLTFATIRSILTTINIKLMGGSSVNSSGFQQKSIIQSLSLVRNLIVDARQHWVSLCSKSFDADNQTLLMSGLMIRQCLLLEEFLAILCEQKREKKLSEILIEDLGENGKNFRPNAQTLNFHMLLSLARTQLLQISNADNDLILNLKMLKEILRTLTNFQLGLPRFFFQRIQSTRIKLIISPQPPDGRTTVRVNSADLLPLIVEGIVESNNHKSIESVCVVLTLKRENAAATEKKQNIQFESAQKYFRAQFLLKIHQKTKISAKIWFVDAVAKKQWFDESDSVSLTVELMDT